MVVLRSFLSHSTIKKKISHVQRKNHAENCIPTDKKLEILKEKLNNLIWSGIRTPQLFKSGIESDILKLKKEMIYNV